MNDENTFDGFNKTHEGEASHVALQLYNVKITIEEKEKELKKLYEDKKAMEKRMLELSVILSTVNHFKKLTNEIDKD